MTDKEEKSKFGYYEYQSREIRKILKFDFLSLVEKHNGHYRLKGKSQRLISPSSLTKFISELELYPVPQNVLETAKERGKQVMQLLEEVFNNRITDLNNVWGSIENKLTIQALINWLIDRNLKVVAVEKFITNGVFCGFVDMIVWDRDTKRYWIYEIKCRNSTEPKGTDLVQMEVYHKMLHNIPCRLMIIDRNNKITTSDWNTKGDLVEKKMNQFPKSKYQSSVTNTNMLITTFNNMTDLNIPWVKKIKIGFENG